MKARPVTHAGQRAPGEEEVDRVGDRPAGHDPDAEDEHEVDDDEQVVDQFASIRVVAAGTARER